jgi:hypothetical protein
MAILIRTLLEREVVSHWEQSGDGMCSRVYSPDKPRHGWGHKQAAPEVLSGQSVTDICLALGTEVSRMYEANAQGHILGVQG